MWKEIQNLGKRQPNFQLLKQTCGACTLPTSSVLNPICWISFPSPFDTDMNPKSRNVYHCILCTIDSRRSTSSCRAPRTSPPLEIITKFKSRSSCCHNSLSPSMQPNFTAIWSHTLNSNIPTFHNSWYQWEHCPQPPPQLSDNENHKATKGHSKLVSLVLLGGLGWALWAWLCWVSSVELCELGWACVSLVSLIELGWA